MLDPFELVFVRRGMLEVLLLSGGAGLLGTWIVLRGLAFYSHSAGSATFPGLVLADGLGFAAPLGAFGAALAFALGVSQLARARRSGADAVTAVVLVGALALGVILASDVFESGSRVETLLFGSLLAIQDWDLVVAGAASALAMAATAGFGRAWLAAGFDPSVARAIGLRSPLPDLLLLALIAVVVTAVISAAGALLTASLLVVPAATARPWTSRLGSWQATAVLLAALEGVAGLWLSVKLNAPPGPTIAVLAGACFAASALARALRPRAATAALAALLALATLAACGGEGEQSGGKVDVVATTTHAADWARQVGGDYVDVHGILQPGTDPHDYEPRPADVEAVAGADVVLKSGNGIDDWIGGLLEQAGVNPTVVDLAGAVGPKRSPAGGSGTAADPHWWQDPREVRRAALAIGAALARTDPANTEAFANRAQRYAADLERVDRRIAACMAAVPRSRRKLVTDHDAFSPFARRYGIEVVGAVIPSQTTQAQPSARDVSKLVEVMKREDVRAIFPEESLNDRLARSIARETGAVTDYTLYGDALGSKGSAGATYAGMLAANADAMVRGFSAGRLRCRT